MPIRCPKCGMKHDVVKFSATEIGGSASGEERGPWIRCRCGLKLDLSCMETVEDFLRYFESEEERKKARDIQQEAQAICQMILDEQCPAIDIEIAKRNLKEKVRHYFPDKMQVYEMIYEARFRRLWDQFRISGPRSG